MDEKHHHCNADTGVGNIEYREIVNFSLRDVGQSDQEHIRYAVSTNQTINEIANRAAGKQSKPKRAPSRFLLPFLDHRISGEPGDDQGNRSHKDLRPLEHPKRNAFVVGQRDLEDSGQRTTGPTLTNQKGFSHPILHHLIQDQRDDKYKPKNSDFQSPTASRSRLLR